MIYFDHAACLPPDSADIAVFNELLLRCNANSESTHAAGRTVKLELEQAGQTIAATLMPQWAEPQVYFAASGSDAFNLLWHSLPEINGNVVGSAFDHPALTNMLKHVGGLFNFAALPERIMEFCRAETQIIALTHVQSELGVITPVDELILNLRKCSPRALMVVDTIQSAGKLPLPTLADVVILSGHKIGAVGGAALVINPRCKMKFDFNAVRHADYYIGRAEPLQILFMAEMAKRFAANQTENLAKVIQINRYLRSETAKIPGVIATMPLERTSPYILHLRIKDKQGAIIARMLSEHNIMVSSGSACRAESGGPSAALSALGLRGNAAYEGLRLSFSPANTPHEAERFIEVLNAVLKDY